MDCRAFWHGTGSIFLKDFEGFSDPDKDRSILKAADGGYRQNIFLDFNTSTHGVNKPLYTMRELPSKGLPSAYLIYMTSSSEYEAAMKLVGSWQHWEKLCKSRPFMEGTEDAGQWSGLQAWRKEKEIKDRAIAYNQLRVNAATGNVQAQKMLYEGIKAAYRRGRPSKAGALKLAQEEAKHLREIKDDFKRVKLVIKNGTSTGNS